MVSTGSESLPLNFIVRAFDYQNLNSPLISLFPLTGWLYVTTVPLTFLHPFECLVCCNLYLAILIEYANKHSSYIATHY